LRLRVMHVVQSARPHEPRRARHPRRFGGHPRVRRCGGSPVQGTGLRSRGRLRAASDTESHRGRTEAARRRCHRAGAETARWRTLMFGPMPRRFSVLVCRAGIAVMLAALACVGFAEEIVKLPVGAGTIQPYLVSGES